MQTTDLLDLDNPGPAERAYVRSLCPWKIAFVPEAASINGKPVGDHKAGVAVSGEIGAAS